MTVLFKVLYYSISFKFFSYSILFRILQLFKIFFLLIELYAGEKRSQTIVFSRFPF